MGVVELGKAPRTQCEHQDPGCRIYESRPESCRGYVCGWLFSPEMFPQEALRPDLCGVMFDFGMVEGTGDPAVVVRELTPYAAAAYWVVRALKRIEKKKIRVQIIPVD